MKKVVAIIDIDNTSFVPVWSVARMVRTVYGESLEMPDEYGLEFFPEHLQRFIDSLYRSEIYMCHLHRRMVCMKPVLCSMHRSFVAYKDVLFELVFLTARHSSLNRATVQMVRRTGIYNEDFPVSVIVNPEKHGLVSKHYKYHEIIWIDDNPKDLRVANKLGYYTIKSKQNWNKDLKCNREFKYWAELMNTDKIAEEVLHGES